MSKNELVIIPKIEKYIEYMLTKPMGTVLFDNHKKLQKILYFFHCKNRT